MKVEDMATIVDGKLKEIGNAKLQRGTRIIDSWGDEAIVTRFTVDSKPMKDTGGGIVDLIYLDDHHVRKVSDHIVRGCGWEIVDGLASEVDVEALETMALDKLKAKTAAKAGFLTKVEGVNEKKRETKKEKAPKRRSKRC